MAKTTAYRILVVVVTVIITLILLGSAMDKLLSDRIRAEVVEVEHRIKFNLRCFLSVRPISTNKLT